MTSNNTQNQQQQQLLAATSMTSIPPPGEEVSLPLLLENNASTTSSNFFIRHGSSLSLMSDVCEFLANPIQNDTFNYIDPTADHHKWARKGMDLYYACVVDANGGIVCALRAATEGIMTQPTATAADIIHGLVGPAAPPTTTTSHHHHPTTPLFD